MSLEHALAVLRRRAVAVDLARRLLIVLAVWALTAEAAWATGGPAWMPAAAGGAGLFWAVAIAVQRAPSTAEIARRLDAHAGLRDLVSTAVDPALAPNPLRPLIEREAGRAAATVAPGRVFPMTWPQPSRGMVVVVLALQTGVVALRWTAPERVAPRAGTFPAVASPAASDTPAGSAAPGASRPRTEPPPAGASADAARTPGAGPRPVGPEAAPAAMGAGAGAGARSGPPAGPLAGAGSRSARIPAAYRDIVERYFSTMRSPRAAAPRPSGLRQP